MKHTHKNYNYKDILFIVIIETDSKYFGINGMMELSNKFPNTIEIIISHIQSNDCKFVCITRNISDLKYLSDNYSVQVREI
jgi:hypothetical protein